MENQPWQQWKQTILEKILENFSRRCYTKPHRIYEDIDEQRQRNTPLCIKVSPPPHQDNKHLSFPEFYGTGFPPCGAVQLLLPRSWLSPSALLLAGENLLWMTKSSNDMCCETCTVEVDCKAWTEIREKEWFRQGPCEVHTGFSALQSDAIH